MFHASGGPHSAWPAAAANVARLARRPRIRLKGFRDSHQGQVRSHRSGPTPILQGRLRRLTSRTDLKRMLLSGPASPDTVQVSRGEGRVGE